MYSRFVKKWILFTLIFTVSYPAFHPTLVYAQEALDPNLLYDQSTLNEYADQGWEPYDPNEMVEWIEEGEDLFNNAPSPSFDPATNAIQPIDRNGAPLTTDTGQPTTLDQSALGSNGGAANTTADSDNFGDNTSMLTRGATERSRLYNSGENVEDPADAQAYRIIREGYSAPTPDLTNDPVLDGVQYITSEQGESDFDEHYGRGCETNELLVSTGSRSIHTPDLRQCTRSVVPAQVCSASHELTFTTPIIDVIFILDGTRLPLEGHALEGLYSTLNMIDDVVSIDEFDVEVGLAYYGHPVPPPGPLNVWTPAPFMQPIGNSPAEFQSLIDFQNAAIPLLGNGVANFHHTMQTIDRLYTPRAGADTVYIQVHAAGPIAQTIPVYIGPVHDYFYVSSRNQTAINYPITELLSYPLNGDEILETLAQFTEVETDRWVSDGNCLALLENAAANDCDVAFSNLEPEYGARCAIFDDREICDQDDVYADLTPFPYQIDGISRLTKNFTATYSCNAITTNCEQFENDPNCSYNGTTPVGQPDLVGNYNQFQEEWDCGVSVDAPTLVNPAGYSNCGNSPTRCAMGECTDPRTESSDSFTEVAAAVNAVDMMAYDSHCDVTQIETCLAFSGRDLNCHSVGAGLLIDCCDLPAGATLTEYMSALALMRRIDSSYGSPIASTISGAWSTFSGTITNSSTWQAISKPFASGADALLGNSAGAMTDGLLAGFKQRILQVAADTIANLLGDQVAASLFSYGADGAVNGLGGTVGGAIGSAMGALMTGFMYYQVAVLLVGLLDGCDEEDSELAQARELDSCVYVGRDCAPNRPLFGLFGCTTREERKYCCFNSPLSRIIQESVKVQFGEDFGRYDDPNCDGITFGEMATLDWSQIDWGEWEALMIANDMMPTPADMDIDVLTGNQSSLQDGEEEIAPGVMAQRRNSAQRNNDRFQTIDSNQVHRDGEESLFPATITSH